MLYLLKCLSWKLFFPFGPPKVLNETHNLQEGDSSRVIWAVLYSNGGTNLAQANSPWLGWEKEGSKSLSRYIFHSAGAAHDGIISISKLKPLTDPWMLKAVVMLYQMVQKLRLEYLIGWCWTMTFQTHTFVWISIFRRITAFWDMGCLFPYICSAPYVV